MQSVDISFCHEFDGSIRGESEVAVSRERLKNIAWELFIGADLASDSVPQPAFARLELSLHHRQLEHTTLFRFTFRVLFWRDCLHWNLFLCLVVRKLGRGRGSAVTNIVPGLPAR